MSGCGYQENFEFAQTWRFKTTKINYEADWQWYLTHYSWRFYGHESRYMLALSSVNTLKRKLTKVPGKLSVSRNSEPKYFTYYFTKIFKRLIFLRFTAANYMFFLYVLFISLKHSYLFMAKTTAEIINSL